MTVPAAGLAYRGAPMIEAEQQINSRQKNVLFSSARVRPSSSKAASECGEKRGVNQLGRLKTK
jgi:hypothetical protein